MVGKAYLQLAGGSREISANSLEILNGCGEERRKKNQLEKKERFTCTRKQNYRLAPGLKPLNGSFFLAFLVVGVVAAVAVGGEGADRLRLVDDAVEFVVSLVGSLEDAVGAAAAGGAGASDSFDSLVAFLAVRAPAEELMIKKTREREREKSVCRRYRYRRKAKVIQRMPLYKSRITSNAVVIACNNQNKVEEREGEGNS